MWEWKWFLGAFGYTTCIGECYFTGGLLFFRYTRRLADRSPDKQWGFRITVDNWSFWWGSKKWGWLTPWRVVVLDREYWHATELWLSYPRHKPPAYFKLGNRSITVDYIVKQTYSLYFLRDTRWGLTRTYASLSGFKVSELETPFRILPFRKSDTLDTFIHRVQREHAEGHTRWT